MKRMICLLTVCLLLIVMPMGVSADGDVAAMLEALPSVEQFQAMDADAQLEAYNKTQAAYDAYMALSDEEKAAMDGAEETFEALFAHFNSLVMPAEPAALEVEVEIEEPRDQKLPMILVMAVAFAAGFVISRKRKR